MASPQRENGHIEIATEIWERLTKIRIPGQARQVLDFILRKTYGWNKKTDAISLSQFVGGTGLHKNTVCRALNKLLDMRLITKKGNAKSLFTQKGNDTSVIYGFQKDYDQWQPLPKKRTYPKKRTHVPQKENQTLPKKRHTIDTITIDTITIDKKNTAFPKKPEKAGSSEPFYLTKKKKKLTGWKLETFELFWKTFDWKKDKANASDSWLQIPGLTKELALKQIVPAAGRYCDGRADLIANRHTPKWAQGWLSSRRWEDEKFEDKQDGFEQFLRAHKKAKKVV